MKKVIYSPGEPAGIGPDLIIKIACSQSWENFKMPIVSIGDPNLFLERAKLLSKKISIDEIDVKVDILLIAPIGMLCLHGNYLSDLIVAREKMLTKNGIVVPKSLKLITS